ncbi:hypothetical protein FNH22_00400 [Fulvivirga sp. M361]|uniref:hypothetical protein n=1 Tax=Fulvivirga sp. M361 TaxID=2594266 RepID=UPI00117A9222|nr:hypothetical protein [Fulvivirga sp. M361]TRX62590.1 hypothetical protein FNH22_00400 [Fulvivirga sp. M361]
MHRILWILFTFFCSMASAQQIFLEAGKSLSIFDYKNSEGEGPENFRPGSNTVMGAGLRIQLSRNIPSLHGLFGIYNNQYSASGSDTTYRNTYQWDVNYASVNLGFDFEFIRSQNLTERRRGLTTYLRVMGSSEFLFQGNQTINGQRYDLVKEEQFDRPFIFLRGGLGSTYCVSKDLALFLQYMGGLSVGAIGKDNGDGEELRIITHQVGLGMIISLGGCDYCYTGFR